MAISDIQTLMRQVQLGFREESSYGVEDRTRRLIRPVVTEFNVPPTQERFNVGRTGSIDASRSHLTSETFEYNMTVEADPKFSWWFLKWALGHAVSAGPNKSRFLTLPLDRALPSFSCYLDTQQNFVADNERTLLLTGLIIQSFTLRSGSDEKNAMMEISGPLRQPKVSDEFPFPITSEGIQLLPAHHPVAGFENRDIRPYIHQNFEGAIGGTNLPAYSVDNMNTDMLEFSFTINNDLKINFYPRGDNNPFIGEVIYQGRELMVDWTTEYENMTEYQIFHQAGKLLRMTWEASHIDRYVSGKPYKVSFSFPSLALNAASNLIQAGSTVSTMEQSYTSELLARADTTEQAVTTPTPQDLALATDNDRIANKFTWAPMTDHNALLTFIELPLVASSDIPNESLILDLYSASTATDTPPDTLIASSQEVNTRWIGPEVVPFIFNDAPLLSNDTAYWMVLRKSGDEALTAAHLKINGEDVSNSNSSASGTESAGSVTWTVADIQWNFTLGTNGVPVAVDVEGDENYVTAA